MFKLPLFVFTIKSSDTFFSIHQKVLWILSANVMQDYQFKYILHCLYTFYLQPFLFFFAPGLHIIEWKGSCKEFLFCSAVSFLFKSDNISRATFRGGAWVNDITKNSGDYREVTHFVRELFVYSHISNGSLLSGKTKSSGKSIEEIWYFPMNRMERQFWRFDDSRVDLKFCDIRIMSVKCLNCLIWLKECPRIQGKFQ